MIRLSIVFVHTVLALTTATGGAWWVALTAAHRAWERGFYGDVSADTWTLSAASAGVVLFGAGHAVAVWTWFAGSRFGGVTVIAASLVLASGAPWSLVAVLAVTSMLVWMDLLVMQARAASDPPTD